MDRSGSRDSLRLRGPAGRVIARRGSAGDRGRPGDRPDGGPPVGAGTAGRGVDLILAAAAAEATASAAEATSAAAEATASNEATAAAAEATAADEVAATATRTGGHSGATEPLLHVWHTGDLIVVGSADVGGVVAGLDGGLLDDLRGDDGVGQGLGGGPGGDHTRNILGHESDDGDDWAGHGVWDGGGDTLGPVGGREVDDDEWLAGLVSAEGSGTPGAGGPPGGDGAGGGAGGGWSCGSVEPGTGGGGEPLVRTSLPSGGHDRGGDRDGARGTPDVRPAAAADAMVGTWDAAPAAPPRLAMDLPQGVTPVQGTADGGRDGGGADDAAAGVPPTYPQHLTRAQRGHVPLPAPPSDAWLNTSSRPEAPQPTPSTVGGSAPLPAPPSNSEARQRRAPVSEEAWASLAHTPARGRPRGDANARLPAVGLRLPAAARGFEDRMLFHTVELEAVLQSAEEGGPGVPDQLLTPLPVEQPQPTIEAAPGIPDELTTPPLVVEPLQMTAPRAAEPGTPPIIPAHLPLHGNTSDVLATPLPAVERPRQTASWAQMQEPAAVFGGMNVNLPTPSLADEQPQPTAPRVEEPAVAFAARPAQHPPRGDAIDDAWRLRHPEEVHRLVDRAASHAVELEALRGSADAEPGGLDRPPTPQRELAAVVGDATLGTTSQGGTIARARWPTGRGTADGSRPPPAHPLLRIAAAGGGVATRVPSVEDAYLYPVPLPVPVVATDATPPVWRPGVPEGSFLSRGATGTGAPGGGSSRGGATLDDTVAPSTLWTDAEVLALWKGIAGYGLGTFVAIRAVFGLSHRTPHEIHVRVTQDTQRWGVWDGTAANRRTSRRGRPPGPWRRTGFPPTLPRRWGGGDGGWGGGRAGH